MTQENMQSISGPVAIIGGGSIGVAFALVFARAGHEVRIQDPSPERRGAIADEIRLRLLMLARAGLLEDGKWPGIAARVGIYAALSDAADGCVMAIECAPEQRDIKRAIFQQLDARAPAGVPLCSTSSALPISTVCDDLPGRHRCLVAHPGNPPYLIPVVELVPAEFTCPAALESCRMLMERAGMQPVVVRREIEGFVFNRLQGALLREAYCLVRDGVATVEAIDTVVRAGLGLRWSFMGPFETVDLNTRGGIASHAAKMGPAYARMGAERGQDDPWTPELVKAVEAQRRQQLPLEQWELRVEWRDAQLMAIAKLRKS